MDPPFDSAVPVLQFGSLLVEFRSGDVLLADADAFCCPVDQQGVGLEGVFGVISRAGAFEGNPFGTRDRLIPGEAVLVPVKNLKIAKAILVAVFNAQCGTLSRQAVHDGTANALRIAEADGIAALACPVLGHPKSHADFDMVASVMVKVARDFGVQSPKRLKTVKFYAFNATAHAALQAQFFAYQQNLEAF